MLVESAGVSILYCFAVQPGEGPMRLSCAVTLVGLFFAAVAGAAPSIRPASDVGPGDFPRITVTSSSEAGVDLLFDLPTLAMDEVSIGARTFQIVTIPGGGLTGDVGEPGLPTFARFVSIPDDAGVTVHVTAESEVELAGYTVMPIQADEGAEFAIDANAYLRTGFGSDPIASAGRPALCRDLRVSPITFRPVRYDPARGILKVADRVRVEIRFSGYDSENARPIHRNTISPSFDRLYRELVVNYSGPPVDATVAPGTYLVICPNSTAVTSRLQALIDWRTRKGIPTRLATTSETGSSNTSIKAYIQNAYNTWTIPPEYVCLVGDASGTYSIPTFHENLSGYGGEGDHEYTLLAGGDVLSDIHIGRLSISSTDNLDTEVAKVLGYETNPYMDTPSWFTRACLTGDPSSSGISCIQVQQWIKERLRDIGYAQIDTVFSGNFVSGMQTALNRGDTVFSYRGYYQMSGWGNSNTNSLTNGWKLPFCVTITCDTGSFESDNSCRSEGFLRAGTATSPKGGIGAIGTATTGTHTRFNNCIHVGIFYGLLYAGHTTMGSALTRGKYELYLNYQANDPNRVIIWSTWNNLMGDPLVDIYLQRPVRIVPDHPASIAVGTNAVTVVAQDSLNAPIPDALVCLYKGTETYATGFSGSDGVVELPVSTPTSGNMLVTITRHNNIAYQGTIAVAGAQRYVSYQACTIDDDGGAPSNGNGDHNINPGEVIELPVQVKNFGSLNAAGVTGVLSTDDPYTTVTSASCTFGDVPAGGSVWSPSGFVFSVSKACPDRHVIRFALDTSSGSDQWHSIIEVPVVAADLVFDGITIPGDGRIDPGELSNFTVKLKNLGGASAVQPTATLIPLSDCVRLPDATATYNTIAPNGTGENTFDAFTVQALSGCYQGYVASFRMILRFSSGISDTTLVQVPIGETSSDDPAGPDAYGYYAFDDTDVTYPEHPTYSWIELDPAQGGSGGTEIVLGDMGNEQDKSTTVTIPFPFRYYGSFYTRATVCSNGWITMGSTYLTDYRNWALPSGDAPDNIVAVFWDELYQSSTSKCYQRYDAAQHRWIVEWSRFRNMASSSTYETFEAIFYDPAYVTTETGDGKILMQYREVGNVDATDGYATVGIQNLDHSSGLEYTFFNHYATGAATLGVNRAIMFVPTRENLTAVGSGAGLNRFGLEQNQPNPFNPRTVIRFSLDQSGPTSLTIFDVSGRAVRRLISGAAAAGAHTAVWDGRDDAGRALPSGIYLYRLDAGDGAVTKKMIMLQ
jgi:hypothetical protein